MNNQYSKYRLARRDFLKMGGIVSAGIMMPLKYSRALLTKPANNNNWDHYFLGAAYYPEWWGPSEWENDFRQMHELGLNTVRMGEFAWAKFEPAEGKFDFDWMDKAVAIAARYKIDVIMCTPTDSPPPWLYQEHNDIMGGNELGAYTYGGRKGYCVNSPDYLKACANITNALAEHYGRNPGVIGWQLDNEPGNPFKCFDANCEQAFRVWLQKRYGSLAELNKVWNGGFWSNEYTDWAQIGFPKNSAEGGWQPAISLDYRRFFSGSYLNYLKTQALLLRGKIKNQFIFTNWPFPQWSVDIFAGAEFLDACAWDNYTSAPGISNFKHQYISGFNHDITRCAGPNQRFICPEQIANLPSNALNGALRLQAYMGLAHGSYGHLYFEWRRPDAGSEQYRPSMIKRFDGTIGPTQLIFEQIAREFKRLGPVLAGAETKADIALLYDFGNQWSQGFNFSGRDARDYYDYQSERYYNGLKVLQRNIDIVPLKTDFSTYKLIVAANLRLVDDATVSRLVDFVSRGGILLLNYRCGTQNMDNSMRHVLSPGPFAGIAGLSVESKLDLLEYNEADGALDKKASDDLGIVFQGSDTVFHPSNVLEKLSLHGAEPVAVFKGGRMAGLPAITQNSYRNGKVYYVATDCNDDTFHGALARMIGNAGNLSPLISVPDGVEVVSRESREKVYYFLLNLTENSFNNIALPAAMDELITGQTSTIKISLPPLEAAVLMLIK
jgi:beta-galactosidase